MITFSQKATIRKSAQSVPIQVKLIFILKVWLYSLSSGQEKRVNQKARERKERREGNRKD
jgi:hypothetical protein